MIAGSHSDHYEWSAKLDKFDREENKHHELGWDKIFHLQLSNDGSTIISNATPARELRGIGGQYLVINSPERDLDGDLSDYTAELTLEYKRKEGANVPQIKEVITKTTIKSVAMEIGMLWPLGSTDLEAEGIIASVNPRRLLTTELNGGTPALFDDAVATCKEQPGYLDHVPPSILNNLPITTKVEFTRWVVQTTSVATGIVPTPVSWGHNSRKIDGGSIGYSNWSVPAIYHGQPEKPGGDWTWYAYDSNDVIPKHNPTTTHPVRCFRSF
jgi:hypothetical protein